MTELTRSQKIIAEKAVCVMLLRGFNAEGAPVYAYMAVRSDRVQALMRAQEAGDYNPEEYGMLLASGVGEPDADTIAMMEREYGFNHAHALDVSSPTSAEEFVLQATAMVAEEKQKQ